MTEQQMPSDPQPQVSPVPQYPRDLHQPVQPEEQLAATAPQPELPSVPVEDFVLMDVIGGGC